MRSWLTLKPPYAEMAKLVDASASKAGVEKRVGPSPTFGTNQPPLLGDDKNAKW